MHPEADAFLDAIFDNPDDDTPRLVYADWLQEHGQENYAQFIRLQCAAAREKLWSDEANRLWEEIGRVWQRLYDEWWPATVDVWQLPGVVSVWNPQTHAFVKDARLRPGLLDAIHFCRGLLRPNIPLTCTQAARYSAFWPSVMSSDASLTLDGSHAALVAIASDSVLQHVRRVRCPLDIEHGPTFPHFLGAMSSFLRSPHLRRVQMLDLVGAFLDGNATEALLELGRLPRVEEVRLHAFFHDGEYGAFGRMRLVARLRKRFKLVVIE